MTTNVKLGVAFDLNGEAIALEPKQALSEIKEKGIDLELPQRAVLGRAGDGLDGILKQLGSDETVTTIKGKLPDFEALTKAYEKVADATLNVEQFHAKIPGTIDKQKGQTSILYTIGLSATWELDGTETGLTLTGIYFEASNEQPALAAQPSSKKSSKKTS